MAKRNSSTPKSGIQSVEKAFSVLEALRTADQPLRLADIVKASGLAPNLARAYLISLERVGVVRQDPATSRYDLGETALQLGLAALSRMDFLATARGVMQELCTEVGETVWLSVWSDRGPVNVAKVDGAHASPFEIRIGSIADLSVTATGQTFLSYLDPSAWRALLKKEKLRMGNDAPSATELNARLADIRQRGLATRPEVVLPHKVLRQFSSMAAPVFDETGAIRAVLTLIGQSGQFDAAPDGANAPALMSAAKRLSARLGYSPRAAA